MKPYMLLAILHFSFSILNSSAAVPLRWTVETSRIQPVAFDVVRGETISLEAHFKSYGTPVATSNMTAFLCWQTNGMAGAWWVTNAVTAADASRVLFTPQMDPGAATVNAFIGLSDEQPNNPTTQQLKHLSYRAAFTLRFRHGPGATPNAIETPPRVLDLAHTVVVNPPWPTQSDFAATTTVMRAELKDYVDQEIEGAGIVSPQTVTNIVDAKIADIPKEGVSTNAVSEIITNHVTSGYLATGQELANYRTLTDNVCHATTGLWTVDDFPEGVTDIQTPVWDSSRSRWTIVYSLNGTVVNGWNENYTESADEIRHPVMDGRFRIGYIHYLKRGAAATYGQPFVTVDNVPSTNGLVTAAITNGLESASHASAQYSTLNAGYTRLYSFVTGATNANFSATNYPPTAADAATRCHYQPENGMDFSTVPASLQLNERRDGAWRTVMDTRDWTVWYYRFKEIGLTNEIARLKAENAALSNRLDNAQAWANFTADGVENPMTDTTVVDRPNMWLMADYEWQKCVSGSNQCWVIRAKNVVLSGGSNTNGFLEICDAFGKPYMRVNKSAESFADPVFTDIYFDSGEGAWYIVYGNSTKPTKGGANAVIQGNGTGKCVLFDEDDPDCPATITWPVRADSYAGHWIMKAVPKPVGGVVPSQMFFGAEITVAGRDYVEYVKEAAFGAGIRVGNNVYEAVESGNTLIWQKKVN